MATPIFSYPGRFFVWWSYELAALLPRRNSGHTNLKKCVVISLEGARTRLLLDTAGQIKELASVMRSDHIDISEFVPIIRQFSNLPVGIRFTSHDFFTRVVELPSSAHEDFDRILDTEMERTTPFRRAEVLTVCHAVHEATAARGKQKVRHLIVKRKTLDPILKLLAAHAITPAFADCWDHPGALVAPVNFLASKEKPRHNNTQALAALGLIALVLAATAVFATVAKFESASKKLADEIVKARDTASTVRQSAEVLQLSAAQLTEIETRITSRIPVAQILEELTTVIPDSTWLNDVRIKGNSVEFTGYSNSASTLVPLLEQSSLFSEATLTSPVVLDNLENKERFSIRVNLRVGGTSKGFAPPNKNPGENE